MVVRDALLALRGVYCITEGKGVAAERPLGSRLGGGVCGFAPA
jgi:hypothetical protein